MTEGLIEHEDGRCRCWWPGTDPLYVAYHDTDWGVPEFDDRALFEKLMLDGFQAGLSWITILRKRENFRSAFAGIVRNRAKIDATISGARAFLAIQERQGFSKFLWDFVEGQPVQNDRRTRSDIPAETETSRAISKALRAEGFNFVGPTIVYAFMQAVGMVNDHLVGCFRHADCAALAERTPAGRGP